MLPFIIETMNQFETAVEIFAADAGTATELPVEIEILRPISIKDAPNHPDFEVSESDLDEYAANYKAGVRKGVPIDIEHRSDAKFGTQAAGWVKDIYTKVTDGKKALMASVEWNGLGKELIGDKRFKFVSPEFVPRGYKDPEAKIGPLNNVLKAITVTNSPLFKGLGAITASEKSTTGLTHRLYDHIIYAEDQGAKMNLDEIRAKALADLTAEEKTFIGENKDKLSDAEQTKFELKDAPVAPVDPNAVKPVVAPATPVAPVAASDGTVAIKASDLEALKAAAAQGVAANETLRRNEAQTFVKGHVSRGALKSDQTDAWVDRIVTADDATSTLIRDSLSALPDSAVIAAGEKGSDDKGTIGGDQDVAADALTKKAEELMAKDDKLGYTDALKIAARDNEDLAIAATETKTVGSK